MPIDVPEPGDLIVINFSPQTGHEQSGRRIGIVLSSKSFNEVTGFSLICPITSQIKGYPFEVALPDVGVPVSDGSPVTGVILSDQVKSMDWKARNIKILAKAPNEVTNDCLAKIATFLT